MNAEELEEQAQYLARERGFFPFPVCLRPDPENPAKTKKTYPCAWKEIENTEEAIAAMPWHKATHVGINCRLSKVWVIDVDDPASLAEFQPPYTCQQLTMREGGSHHLYKAAEFDERNHAGWPIKGQDIRANGGMFVWYGVGALVDEPLEPWPFKAPLKEPKEAPEGPAGEGSWPSTSFGLALLQGACKAVTEAPEGRRNDTLNKEAFWVGQLSAGKCLNPKEAANELFAAALGAGLGREEARNTINSGMASGWRAPVHEAPDMSTTAEEARKPFGAQSLKGFMQAARNPTEFVVDSWFPRGVVTLLGGHGGVGKSFFSLYVACAAACGVDVAARRVPRPMKVLYVSLEDDIGVVIHRLQGLVRKHGFDVALIEANLTIVDGSGEAHSALYVEATHTRPMPFTTRYDELLLLSEGVDLVVVDNASEGFMGNENARIQVVQFVRGLRRIARKWNLAIVLLAHIDKAAARGFGEGNNYSGSTAWHNSVRSRLALVVDGGVLTVKHEKHNYSAEAPAIHLEFQDGTICILSEEEAQEHQEAAKEAAHSNLKDSLLAALEAAPSGLSRKALLSKCRVRNGPIFATEEEAREVLPRLLEDNLVKVVDGRLFHWKKV